MDRETVKQAVNALQAQGKPRPSVREVLGITGGRTGVVADLVRSILGESPPGDAEPLRDWRQSADVQALRTHEAQRRDRLTTIEAAMVKHRNALDSGPGVLRSLWRKIRLDEAHEHDVLALKTSWADHEEQLSRLQAEVDEIREELGGLADAIADVEEVARQLVMANMRDDERVDMHAILVAMDAEIEIQTRRYHRYIAAGKQFGADRAGLPPIQTDAIRLQRAMSPGDRFTLSGPFLERYNQVRAACGLSIDRGIHTKESQVAYDAMMTAKRAHDNSPAVVEHRRQADQYNKELEVERGRQHREHVANTQRAMQDALRK